MHKGVIFGAKHIPVAHAFTACGIIGGFSFGKSGDQRSNIGVARIVIGQPNHGFLWSDGIEINVAVTGGAGFRGTLGIAVSQTGAEPFGLFKPGAQFETCTQFVTVDIGFIAVFGEIEGTDGVWQIGKQVRISCTAIVAIVNKVL
ncbi:MAG: hypothetical protein ACR5LF_12045 [Symbiopectobacterium sp.]